MGSTQEPQGYRRIGFSELGFEGPMLLRRSDMVVVNVVVVGHDVHLLPWCVYSTLFMLGVMMGWIVVEFHVDGGEMWPSDDGCGSSCEKELKWCEMWWILCVCEWYHKEGTWILMCIWLNLLMDGIQVREMSGDGREGGGRGEGIGYGCGHPYVGFWVRMKCWLWILCEIRINNEVMIGGSL